MLELLLQLCRTVPTLPNYTQAQESTQRAHGPRLGVAPLAHHCIKCTIASWLGGQHGVVGDSSQPSALAPTLRNGHSLTTPLSPQTLKIIRTAELSPFIVFIAPTDKAEQVGGRAPRLSPSGQACLPMAGGAGSLMQQTRTLSLLHISFFLSALIFVVQESTATSSAQT